MALTWNRQMLDAFLVFLQDLTQRLERLRSFSGYGAIS